MATKKKGYLRRKSNPRFGGDSNHVLPTELRGYPKSTGSTARLTKQNIPAQYSNCIAQSIYIILHVFLVFNLTVPDAVLVGVNKGRTELESVSFATNGVLLTLVDLGNNRA